MTAKQAMDRVKKMAKREGRRVPEMLALLDIDPTNWRKWAASPESNVYSRTERAIVEWGLAKDRKVRT